VLAVVIAITFAFVQLRIVVIPVIIALIVASAARPLVTWLEKHGWPSGLAAITTLVTGVAVFGGVVTVVVFGVRSQWDDLRESVTGGVDSVIDFVNNDLPFPVDEEQIQGVRDSLLDFVTSAQFGSGALAGVTTVVELLTSAVLAIVIFFFFLKDGPVIWEFLLKPFRPRFERKARRAGEASTHVLGGYVRGTAIVALVDSVFIGVGLWILGVPLALPLAVIVFIGAFIPIVGATLAGTVAALVALVTNDLTTALIVIAIVVGVNQLEGNLLQPIVLGQSLKLHALVVLLALTAGTVLGGIIGTLLSVPIAAVTWAAIKAWNQPDDPEPTRKRPATMRGRLFRRRRAAQ